MLTNLSVNNNHIKTLKHTLKSRVETTELIEIAGQMQSQGRNNRVETRKRCISHKGTSHVAGFIGPEIFYLFIYITRLISPLFTINIQ